VIRELDLGLAFSCALTESRSGVDVFVRMAFEAVVRQPGGRDLLAH
jgi:hypothetical protein